jgi:hypothetical protein
MTRDEVIRIAWEVGIFMQSHRSQDEPTKLERFAALVAAAEREACARVAEDFERFGDTRDVAAAIRARGEV